MTTTEPGGAVDGIDELSYPDDLIKHIRPSCLDVDEGKQVINKRIQCLGQLPTSCQIVEGSLKPTLISPKALQK